MTLNYGQVLEGKLCLGIGVVEVIGAARVKAVGGVVGLVVAKGFPDRLEEGRSLFSDRCVVEGFLHGKSGDGHHC